MGRDRQDNGSREHQHLGLQPAVTFGDSDYNHKRLCVAGHGGLYTATLNLYMPAPLAAVRVCCQTPCPLVILTSPQPATLDKQHPDHRPWHILTKPPAQFINFVSSPTHLNCGSWRQLQATHHTQGPTANPESFPQAPRILMVRTWCHQGC